MSCLFIRIEQLGRDAQNLINVIISHRKSFSMFASKFTLETIGTDQNLCQVLHIIVDKLNELLVYPHIIFMCSCTKLVKYDYLTQKKVFDLCFKIHSGDRRN